EFAHIHPELQADNTYRVSYTFPRAGTYSLYADYTRPGGAQTISRFDLKVQGPARGADRVVPDREWTKTVDGLQVKLSMPAQLRAGQDLTFRFDVSADDLEPYLGAWGHIMIVSADRQEFIHAHPVDSVGGHSHATPGPSPASISTITG